MNRNWKELRQFTGLDLGLSPRADIRIPNLVLRLLVQISIPHGKIMVCRKAEQLLHCVPPSNFLNALSYLRQSGDAESRNFANLHPVPFEVVEPFEGKPFLACSYNMRNSRHRSPWDNILHPRSEHDRETDMAANDDLRSLEIMYNEVWRAYASLYYGHESVSSVYLEPTHTGSFECLFGIQKVCAAGSWNSSSHVIVADPSDGECSYHIETMVQCVIQPKTQRRACDDRSSISAVVSKTTTRRCKLSANTPHTVSHMENIGTIIESNEIDLRSNLENVLIPKNQEAIESLMTTNTRQNVHAGVNPIMGMVMDSEMLKRHMASSHRQLRSNQ